MTQEAGFDLNATVRWVTEVLQKPQPTAVAYRATEPPWQRTFLQISLPVYLASAVAGFVLSWIFGRPFMFGAMASVPLLYLFSLAWSLALIFVAAFIFNFFAGVFEGERNYDRAFATLSLALVPAVLGGALSPLPWIGWLIGLVAGIYGLVLAYQFVPVFLSVPEGKRVVHFVVSLIVAFVANLIVSGLMGAMFGTMLITSNMGVPESSTSEGAGMFGGLERQADFAEQATQDRYEPPADERLTNSQIENYARVLMRTAELRERLSEKFDQLDEDKASLGDLFSGVSDAVRLGTAEMEVVKTGGGNWAEHQWVRNQIEIARVQQDSTAAVKHNYALFLQYRDQLEPYD